MKFAELTWDVPEYAYLKRFYAPGSVQPLAVRHLPCIFH
jgi:hypothetical protein